MKKEYSKEYMQSIEEAMKNEDMLAKIANATSSSEIIAIFAECSIELDKEIADDVFNRLTTVKETGELDDETLEAVNGGVITEIGSILAFASGVVTFSIVWGVGTWIVNKIFK